MWDPFGGRFTMGDNWSTYRFFSPFLITSMPMPGKVPLAALKVTLRR